MTTATIIITHAGLSTITITVTADSRAAIAEQPVGRQMWRGLMVDGSFFPLVLCKHVQANPEAVVQATDAALADVLAAIASLQTPPPAPPTTGGDDRTPLSALKSAQTYCEHLADQTCFRLNQAARTPALDCADLAALFKSDKDAAWARLATLNAGQLVVQAYAMASYLSSEGRAVEGGDVLGRWQTGLARRAEAGPTTIESAVMGALERLAEEHARSARTARVQGLKDDAKFFQRNANAFTRALLFYRAGLRPSPTQEGGWLLPSQRPGEAPHLLTMSGDWTCTCPSGQQIHWASALLIGIEAGTDDLNRFDDCGETAATHEEPPPAAPLGQRIAQARARVWQEAA